MKPVAIFRHVGHEGPGLLGESLEERAIPWQLIAIDRNDPIPDSPEAYSGLVFMGGPMSANDELPWIAAELELIRKAAKAGIPLLGHCLGGQLIAKALGGQIGRNPVKEIGWAPVRTVASPETQTWFDGMEGFVAFHWHGETFSIPAGATRILESEHCANQAFVMDGIHLAMQCHVEMTEPMIQEWCAVGADEIAASDSPAVESPERILAGTAQHLSHLQATAKRLYNHWLNGLTI